MNPAIDGHNPLTFGNRECNLTCVPCVNTMMSVKAGNAEWRRNAFYGLQITRDCTIALTPCQHAFLRWDGGTCNHMVVLRARCRLCGLPLTCQANCWQRGRPPRLIIHDDACMHGHDGQGPPPPHPGRFGAFEFRPGPPGPCIPGPGGLEACWQDEFSTHVRSTSYEYD